MNAPGFTCPRCGRTSYHPKDLEQGYCGACHDWTRESTLEPFDAPEHPGCPVHGKEWFTVPATVDGITCQGPPDDYCGWTITADEVWKP